MFIPHAVSILGRDFGLGSLLFLLHKEYEIMISEITIYLLTYDRIKMLSSNLSTSSVPFKLFWVLCRYVSIYCYSKKLRRPALLFHYLLWPKEKVK